VCCGGGSLHEAMTFATILDSQECFP
jgi:hypothetical protein